MSEGTLALDTEKEKVDKGDFLILIDKSYISELILLMPKNKSKSIKFFVDLVNRKIDSTRIWEIDNNRNFFGVQVDNY